MMATKDKVEVMYLRPHQFNYLNSQVELYRQRRFLGCDSNKEQYHIKLFKYSDTKVGWTRLLADVANLTLGQDENGFVVALGPVSCREVNEKVKRFCQRYHEANR